MWVMFDRDLEEGSLETYHSLKSYVWQTMIDRAICQFSEDDELSIEYRRIIKNGYENFYFEQVKEELDLWNYDIHLLDDVQYNNVTCLHCGTIQIPKKIYNDENGDFTLCKKCESSFDIHCDYIVEQKNY